MTDGKKIIAIIPARGGSKGLPGKNITPFCGKPMIAWTIEAALKSAYIDRVIVSTDDESIADVSKKYGADIPFIRPKELAADNSTSSSVVIHALDYIKRNEKTDYEIFLLLQPTSPLRTSKHIDEAIEKFIKFTGAKALVSVCTVSEHPAWMKVINGFNLLENYENSEGEISRRQDLTQLYILNGAIYMMNTEEFMKEKTFNIPECTYYIMDEYSSIDIDNRFDMKLAEVIKSGELNTL